MMESVEEVKRKSKGKETRFGRRYGYEFRLRAVKLRLEKGIPVTLLCKELGVGEEIDRYLSEKFDRYGVPFVLKRDNEATLNHQAVNEVLEQYYVLPLNSPDYYAPYNGAIEESQREIKKCFWEKLSLGLSDCGDHLSAYAEAAVNDLNHRLRPCLRRRTSCQVFFGPGNRPVLTKRERREMYDCVMEKMERILSALNQSGQAVRESAWRIALESWLRSKGYIRIHINQKCHPISPHFLAHH